MKNFLILLAITFCMTACIIEKKTTVVQAKPAQSRSKPMPPGQAKKASGSQSAKAYAPGHQKKK